MKRLFVVTLIAAIILGVLTLPVQAAPKKIPADKIAQMKRGTKNVALGWTEIPNSIVAVTKDTNNPFLGITVGLLKGAVNAFARTLSGAVDVVSVPVNSDADKPLINTKIIVDTE